MAIRVSVRQEFSGKRSVVTFTARLFEDVLASEASSRVLTDFGVVFEVTSIEAGGLLFELVLIDSSKSIIASGVTEEEVAEYVGESAGYLGLVMRWTPRARRRPDGMFKADCRRRIHVRTLNLTPAFLRGRTIFNSGCTIVRFRIEGGPRKPLFMDLRRRRPN